MAEAPITSDDAPPLDDWELGDDQPVYFVVDDQYNEYERYIYIEVRREGVTLQWFEDLVRVLRDWDGWGVGVTNITGGYVLVFGDRLLVSGRTFDLCSNSVAVLDAWGRHVRGENCTNDCVDRTT